MLSTDVLMCDYGGLLLVYLLLLSVYIELILIHKELLYNRDQLARIYEKLTDICCTLKPINAKLLLTYR